MKFKIPESFKTIPRFNAFLISSLTFAGFYVLLVLFVVFSLGDSRSLTIPVRIFICTLAISHLLFFWIRKKTLNAPALAFYIFALLYLLRIVWELFMGTGGSYHQPKIDFLLYFISFGIIPFIFFIQIKGVELYESIFNGVFYSAVVFSILSYVLFGFLLGSGFGRISFVSDLETISPLAFSYCAAQLLGIAFYKLFINKENIKSKKVIYVVALLVAVIPFFLGSSRGSILALFFSILFVLLFNKGFKTTIRVSFWGILSILTTYFVSKLLGSNLFSRFLGIGNDIALNSSSTYRLVIWKKSIHQFAQNPLLGNSLESDFANFYPHNILIESMITTGIFGFILLMGLMIFGLYRSALIIKNRADLSWIPIIFVQALVKNMLSGGLYSAVWFWATLGLVFSVNINKKLKNKTWIR